MIRTTFLADADTFDRLSHLRGIKAAQQAGTETTAPITNIIAIGASVLPGIPLTASLAYQADVQNEIVERLRHFEAVFRRFVIPFFASFWLGKIDTHPDAFQHNRPAEEQNCHGLRYGDAGHGARHSRHGRAPPRSQRLRNAQNRATVFEEADSGTVFKFTNGDTVTVEENFREVTTAFERTCRW